MSSGPSTPPPAPTIHEASLASGASGGVVRGIEIDLDAATALRRAGKNVVVCGDDLGANRGLARKIEVAVGPAVRGVPHRQSAGPRALPHFQQQDRAHEGHTFYETPNRRAARRKP
jgi:hypothetical protein